MKKYILNIRIPLIIIISAIVLCGCCGGHKLNVVNKEEGYYCIMDIDGASFKDYISIFIRSSDGEYKWLLSKRISTTDSVSNYFSIYENLSIDKWYAFDIILFDSINVLNKKIISGIDVLEINNKILWQNDTIRSKEVYKSNSIIDVYWGIVK